MNALGNAIGSTPPEDLTGTLGICGLIKSLFLGGEAVLSVSPPENGDFGDFIFLQVPG